MFAFPPFFIHKKSVLCFRTHTDSSILYNFLLSFCSIFNKFLCHKNLIFLWQTCRKRERFFGDPSDGPRPPIRPLFRFSFPHQRGKRGLISIHSPLFRNEISFSRLRSPLSPAIDTIGNSNHRRKQSDSARPPPRP